MRRAPRRSRLFDEGCRRYQYFRQRGAKGEIGTERRGSSRGATRSPSQIQQHRAGAVDHSAPLIPEDFLMWLEGVLASAELVSITERIITCRDPKDDKFL